MRGPRTEQRGAEQRGAEQSGSRQHSSGSHWKLSRRTLLVAGVWAVSACAAHPEGVPVSASPTASPSPQEPSPTASATPDPASPSPTETTQARPSRKQIVAEFGDRKPKEFGLFVPGVVTQGNRGIALTFDACGGGKLGNGYDSKLIKLLDKHGVPATLFLNARWIAANPTIASELAANPLFELANHGYEHVPLTVRGQEAYGIAGTADVGAAYDEIVRGQDALAEVSGELSPFFRPGTAWVDDVGVAIAERLGVSIIAFDVNADAGASASAKQVAANLRTARKRSIVLGHFNRPEGDTAEGLAAALPQLLDSGAEFVTISDALT